MKNLKQATTLEEQEIIELSLYGDYKLNFSRANLKTGFSKNNKPANRKFQKVRLEGIGEFSCQVEFIGSVKDILSNMKSESSSLSAHEESKEVEEQAANSFKDDTSSASSFISGEKSS